MDIELSAEVRSKTGKGAARSLRREDRIPAILYGPKTDPVLLSVTANRLEKLMREMGEESKLLNLNIESDDGRQTKQVLIRELQVHPVRRRFLHVDFYEVPMDQPIVIEVPVELVGEAVGVKQGGVLDLVRRMLSVRCLPGEIPEKVEIDISNLEVGSTIHVADLVHQVAFELVDDQNFAVVTISAPEGAAEAEAEEEAGEEEEGEEVTGEQE